MSSSEQKRFQEFELIEYLKSRLVPESLSGWTSDPVLEGLKLGIGDDGALLEVPKGRQLVVTMDTLVEGVHFKQGLAPANLGYKALAVNLSDLAAMGARPGWYFLSLSLPAIERNWAENFCDGIDELASRFGMALAGGDVTLGSLSITITACGTVKTGAALRRSGAQVGDCIAISGTTGLAAKALLDLSAGRQPADACSDALHRPAPRVELGQQLTTLASSCIDVSDGLFADLGHVLRSSGVGAELQLASLPGHSALEGLTDVERWNVQLGGGDDYELCFTYAEDHRELLASIADETGTTVTEIGRIVSGKACRCVRPDGEFFEPATRGYVHGAPN